jgi:cytosine/adenosine deaminase-related metal-dependent hydrolase
MISSRRRFRAGLGRRHRAAHAGVLVLAAGASGAPAGHPPRSCQLLDDLVEEARIAKADGTPARSSPHDVRRSLTTEAVASGLPVHHHQHCGPRSLATTKSYLAIYGQAVIDPTRARGGEGWAGLSSTSRRFGWRRCWL